MTRLDNISMPTEVYQLVAFTSLAGFNKRFVLASDDRLVFETMMDYFAWSGTLIQKAGGTVIKCMGDAMLVSFPEEHAGRGVMALKELKQDGDLWMKQRQIPCHHIVKIHLGPMILGPIGAPGQERQDILGKTVNICATLESAGFVMTPQVFRALDPSMRKHFKKHSLPVTYIRVEDSH